MEDILSAHITIESILRIGLIVLINYALLELLYLYFFKKYKGMKDYKQTTTNFIFVLIINGIVAALIGVLSTSTMSIMAYSHAIFTSNLNWYWWIYGWLVYELFYWIQHYLAHKVRVLWCIHSPHHAPESMNMFVGFNHSFLEVIFYMPFFLGFLPTFFGVHPIIIFSLMLIDVIWGNLLHINDSVLTKKLGFLEKVFQTPSYHRVHHAKNILYMDTNYNSITLFWDWAFGTLQVIQDDEKVQYGITRDVQSSNFFDVQFGELYLLLKDIAKAPSISDKLKYIIKPPGWSHTGHHTGLVSELKKELVNPKV